MIERFRVERPPGYPHAVVASGTRLVPEGNLAGPGDVVAQTRQVPDNLASALDAAGAEGVDVLKTTVCVISESREDLASAWRTVLESGVAGAVSMLLGVSLLYYEGQPVEIEAPAVLG